MRSLAAAPSLAEPTCDWRRSNGVQVQGGITEGWRILDLGLEHKVEQGLLNLDDSIIATFTQIISDSEKRLATTG